MVIRKLIGCVAILALLVSSCVKDTCNSVLGNTFKTVSIDSIVMNIDSSATHYFTYNVLEELPEEYFMAALPFDSITNTNINELSSNKTNLQFTVLKNHLPTEALTKGLAFTFFYGDRRNFISCTHAGSSDLYTLELTFNLTKTSDEEFEFSEFEWKEIFLAGHL